MASDCYTRIIQQAVGDLQAALRAGGGQVTVWAIPTYGSEAGRVIVGDSVPKEYYARPPRYMPRVIRPCDNRASLHTRWESTPYSAQFNILYRALRSEPILPNVEAA